MTMFLCFGVIFCVRTSNVLMAGEGYNIYNTLLIHDNTLNILTIFETFVIK